MTGSILTATKPSSNNLSKMPIIGLNAFVRKKTSEKLKSQDFKNIGMPHDCFISGLYELNEKEEWDLEINTAIKNINQISVDFYSITFRPFKLEPLDLLYGKSWNHKLDMQGIYFCTRSIYSFYGSEIFAKEVVYVGKTKNLKKRFASHNHAKKDALKLLRTERVYFIAYPSEFFSPQDINWAERQYIELLSPILNDQTTWGLDQATWGLNDD